MVTALLRMAGVDLKREARQIVLIVVFALAGAFAAIAALAVGLRALYLWLETQVGELPALGILGGVSVLTAVVMFSLAFLSGRRRPRRVAPSRLASDPAAAAAVATEQALDSAANAVRMGSRESVLGTILVAALAGWIIGRRL